MTLVNVPAEALPVLAEAAVTDLLREISLAAERIAQNVDTIEHHPDRVTKEAILAQEGELHGLLAAYRALAPSLRLPKQPVGIVRAEAIADAALARLARFA